jgi:hypothetical protein
MEFFVMGFAVLIAKEDHGSAAIAYGLTIGVLALLAPGLLKKTFGWIFASALQLLIIGYAFVVPSMAFIGALFAGLWVAAIIVGRKGEAARAKLLAEAHVADHS